MIINRSLFELTLVKLMKLNMSLKEYDISIKRKWKEKYFKWELANDYLKSFLWFTRLRKYIEYLKWKNIQHKKPLLLTVGGLITPPTGRSYYLPKLRLSDICCITMLLISELLLLMRQNQFNYLFSNAKKNIHLALARFGWCLTELYP